MANYYSDESKATEVEAICKEHGREVPALAILLDYPIAKLSAGEKLVTFYNPLGDGPLVGQTIDDFSEINRTLGMDKRARFYAVNYELIQNL